MKRNALALCFLLPIIFLANCSCGNRLNTNNQKKIAPFNLKNKKIETNKNVNKNDLLALSQDLKSYIDKLNFDSNELKKDAQIIEEHVHRAMEASYMPLKNFTQENTSHIEQLDIYKEFKLYRLKLKELKRKLELCEKAARQSNDLTHNQQKELEQLKSLCNKIHRDFKDCKNRIKYYSESKPNFIDKTSNFLHEKSDKVKEVVKNLYNTTAGKIDDVKESITNAAAKTESAYDQTKESTLEMLKNTQKTAKKVASTVEYKVGTVVSGTGNLINELGEGIHNIGESLKTDSKNV